MDKGYEICECGEYAYIYAADVLQRLPPGYTGELCPRCKLWMCAVKYLIAHPQLSTEADAISMPGELESR